MPGLALVISTMAYAGNPDGSKASLRAEKALRKQFKKQLDSTDKKIRYQAGSILIAGNSVVLDIPEQYKFIDSAQTRFILEDLWGNLPDSSVLGMLVRKSFRINNADEEFTYVISHHPIGYVKDHDAGETNYDDLIVELQRNQEKANTRRLEMGYNTMNIVGWAAVPSYDKDNHRVHWAKEIAVTGSDINVLNYEARILGRNSMISFNAVATMPQLEQVKKDLPNVIAIAKFTDGHQYDDFDKRTDSIAELTVGTIITGNAAGQAATRSIISPKIVLGTLVIAGLVSGSFIAFKRKVGRKEA
ncbi:hypothetical protein HY58_00975 [Flavihumibacter sp. ZG627]|nr:hypothetical protein HY58_00975 [Flavihumibacter sp. ZG627]